MRPLIIRRKMDSMCSRLTVYLPGILAVLMSAIITLVDDEHTGFTSYLGAVLGFALEFGFVIIALAVIDTKHTSWLWLYRFIIMFSGTIAWLVVSEFPSINPYIRSSGVDIVVLWSIYGLHYVSEWFKARQTKSFKVTLSLDKALLFLVILASFMSALVINSHPGGVYNQPIPVTIDILYNFQHLPGLLSYWLQLFLVYMCPYLVYYVNHHILIEYFLGQRGIIAYFMSGFTVLLVLYPILSYFVLSLPISDSEYPFIPSQDHNVFAIQNFNTGLLVLAVSLPLVLAFKWQENSRHVSELEKGQLQAELALLQQQINPHFLFNSLNSLYALTLTRSEKAPEAVLQLSNLFRYVVYKGSKTRVPLSAEFSYLSDYLALQRLRMGEHCKFDYHFDEVSSALGIAPLMLIVFLENAFKHGLETNNPGSWLRVTAMVSRGTLRFECENPILHSKGNQEAGIGLKNVRKRLQLQYEGRHSLKINQQDDRFSILLTIELSSI